MSTKLQVPQATLYRVRSVVDAVARGASSPEQVAVAVNASQRHALYGIASATALGLLAGGRQALELTERGEELGRSARGSPEEAAVFRRAIAESPALGQLAPGLLSE